MQIFYLEYRTAVGYAKLKPDDPWPTFNTRKEWKALKSTKMDTCALICKYYLLHDDVEPITFEDGELMLTKPPPDILNGPRSTRRIIIYAEFSTMAPLLQNVCTFFT